MPTLPFWASSCITLWKFSFVCSQSFALEPISQQSSWPCAEHFLVFAGEKKIMSVIGATWWGYFPVGFGQDFPSLRLLVITDLRLQVQGRAFLYGHLSAPLPWFVVSWTTLLPLLVDLRIKNSAHKCQMIDVRTAYVSPRTSAEMLVMVIYYYWF